MMTSQITPGMHKLMEEMKSGTLSTSAIHGAFASETKIGVVNAILRILRLWLKDLPSILFRRNVEKGIKSTEKLADRVVAQMDSRPSQSGGPGYQLRIENWIRKQYLKSEWRHRYREYLWSTLPNAKPVCIDHDIKKEMMFRLIEIEDMAMIMGLLRKVWFADQKLKND